MLTLAEVEKQFPLYKDKPLTPRKMRLMDEPLGSKLYVNHGGILLFKEK